MFKAAIFDMDGILIDSEPLWQDAEIYAFGQVGVKLTRDMCKQTMGIRVDEVVRYWYERHPWNGKTVQEMEADILDKLEEFIRSEGRAMAGVYSMLKFCEEKNLRLALASSSYVRLIDTVLTKLNLTDRFEVIHSGEFEPYGKPHPGIFITTIEKLALQHFEVFVIEDSFPGLIAAKAARMKVICVPDKSMRYETKYDIADLKLDTLSDFNETHFAQLSTPY